MSSPGTVVYAYLILIKINWTWRMRLYEIPVAGYMSLEAWRRKSLRCRWGEASVQKQPDVLLVDKRIIVFPREVFCGYFFRGYRHSGCLKSAVLDLGYWYYIPLRWNQYALAVACSHELTQCVSLKENDALFVLPRCRKKRDSIFWAPWKYKLFQKLGTQPTHHCEWTLRVRDFKARRIPSYR